MLTRPSSPDNLPNNEPEFLVVQGRAAAGIRYVHIHLRSDVSGSLLAQEVVEVIPSSQSSEGTWGWRVEAADHGLILFCGRGFLVEAIGLDNASVALLDTMRSRTTNLVCKPPPANDPPGGSGTTVDVPGPGGPTTGPTTGPTIPGWPFPWPPVGCPTSASIYTNGLLAFMLLLVAALAFLNPITFTTSMVALTLALFYRWIWGICANPRDCARWSRLLWVCKRATIGGVLISLIGLSLPAFILTLSYGVTVGLLTIRMTEGGCELPQVMTPIANLPYN